MCIFSYMFKPVTFKVLSIWCNTPIKMFFSTAQNSFWTHWFWCLLGLLLFFVSLFYISKMFSFEDFFHPGKQKSCSGWDWVNREGGSMGVMPFLVKNCWTFSVGGYTCKSPIMKWANALKVFKKIHRSWTQPLTATPAGTLIQMGS